MNTTPTTIDAAPLIAMRAECDALAARCQSDDKPTADEVEAMEDRASVIEGAFAAQLVALVGDVEPVLGKLAAIRLSDNAWNLAAHLTGSLALNAIAHDALAMTS